MWTDTEVVVIGGGMVGAVAALALTATGRRVAVVEAHEPQPWHPDQEIGLRVSALSRASQRILSHLDVWDDIVSMRATAYQHMQVRDYASSAAIHFSAAEVDEPNLGHIVENSVLQTALVDALQQHPAIAWHCPETLQDFSLEADHITVHLTTNTLTAKLLLAADGSRSRVRELANITVDVTDYHQQAVVAIVESEAGHHNTAWQGFLEHGPVALLPIGERASAVVWSLPVQEAETLLKLDETAFCAALTTASDNCLGKIHTVGARAAFPLFGAHAQRYICPRLALIGDAAHTIHPLAGQGVNLGLLDAAALVDALDHFSDEGDPRALRNYERARRGENQLMLKTMEGFHHLFGKRAPPLVLFRHAGLEIVNRLKPVKKALIRQAMGLSGSLPRLAQL